MLLSENNPIIKKVKRLHTRKGREKYGQYFMEGIKGVEQVFKNGAGIEEVLFSTEVYGLQGGQALIENLKKSGIMLLEVDKSTYKSIGDTITPQYVLAVVEIEHHSIDSILDKDSPLLVVSDGIQDPGNLGTVIRTADAAGADGILLLKGSTDPYNSKCVRSTMGSIFSIPIIQVSDTAEAFGKLRANGIEVVAASIEGDVEYYHLDLTEKVAIVIGNEANGISEETCRYVDRFARIPIQGMTESLNAAVACGIFLYKAVEQRLT